MAEKNLNEFALFKFSLIAPVVNDTFNASSQMQYFRDIASKKHILPNGNESKLSVATVKKWFLDYSLYFAGYNMKTLNKSLRS